MPVRVEQLVDRTLIHAELAHTVRRQLAFDVLKQATDAQPESAAYRASFVFAKPCRAHRISVAPNAAESSVRVVVGATERVVFAELLLFNKSRIDSVGMRVDDHAERRCSDTMLQAIQQLGAPKLRLIAGIFDDFSDEVVGYERNIGTTLANGAKSNLACQCRGWRSPLAHNAIVACRPWLSGKLRTQSVFHPLGVKSG